MARSLALLPVLVLGCTMNNPAFEGGDELAEGTGNVETATTTLESSDTADTSTSDASTSDASTSDTSTSNPGTTTDADTSTSDNSSTDTSGGPLCGDGNIDPGEACDDGNADPSDECTPDCAFPVCGDGYLQIGVEECDDGNTESTDECTNGCNAAVCGDGFVWEGVEECESEGDDGCFACMVSFRHVFVTSELYVGGNIGGLEAADALCNEHAANAGLPGEFKAWLSGGGESPSTRFTHWEVPYMLRTNPKTEVVNGWTDLVDGSGLLSPILVNEFGLAVPAGSCSESDRVWTGTTPSGQAHLQTCNGFTSTNAMGLIGSATSFTNWTMCNATAGCTAGARLYCFQQ